MSLTITPYPTASGMERAMSLPANVAISAKYIGIGKGLQTIEFDDGGRAITNVMKTPVAWLEIMNAEKVTPYQHALLVDFAGVADDEFQLSELVLADKDKNVIAIYGHSTQAITTVSPQVDNAFVVINMVLASFPADSIEIVHQNIQIGILLQQKSLMATHNTLAKMALASMINSLIQQEMQDQQQKMQMTTFNTLARISLASIVHGN